MQMLGELPSPIMEEPMSQRGTAPTSPHSLRPHPLAQHSTETKAARQAAAALQSKLAAQYQAGSEQSFAISMLMSGTSCHH